MGEIVLEKLQQVVAGGSKRRAQRRLLQAAAGGNQTDADFDQADVGLQRDHPLRRMQHQFATAAQSQAGDRGDDRHAGILQGLMRLLQLGHLGLDGVDAA